MKLMDALATFAQTDRLTDGIRMWNADELVLEVAETDDREYDLEYLLDGRMALRFLHPRRVARVEMGPAGRQHDGGHGARPWCLQRKRVRRLRRPTT